MDLLLEALAGLSKPTTTRDLVRILSEEFGFSTSKSDVNSRLYRLLSSGRVQKTDDSVPRWSVHGVSLKNPVRKTQALRACELENVWWIDFEGTMTDPPTFLGVLAPDGDFTQWVTEAGLRTAADAKGKGTSDGCYCIPGDLYEILVRLLDLSGPQALIVGWSYRELVVAKDVLGAESEAFRTFRSRYRDGRVTAKDWFTRQGAIPTPDPLTGDLFSLSAMMSEVGHSVPKAFGPGMNAARIRYVRAQLEAKGSYDRITPVAKAKWTKVLMHNWHDCHGMREVVTTFAVQ